MHPYQGSIRIIKSYDELSSPVSNLNSRLLRVLLFLLAEVSFDLMPEEEHPQLAMRGLIHGLGLHAHSILVRRQLVSTVLLVP